MTRNAIHMVVAIVSTIIHAGKFELGGGLEVHERDAIKRGLVIAIIILCIFLLVEIAALIASIFLILGVQKERHQYIAPWVFFVPVNIMFIFLRLIKSYDTFNRGLVIQTIMLILQAALWYPIFKYWRGLRTSSKPNIRMPLENSATDAGPGGLELELTGSTH